MNLSQILESLPPRVYLRNGELVIHFSTPGDLVTRVAETQAALSGLDRPEAGRADARTSGRSNGRLPNHSEATSFTEMDSHAGPGAKLPDGKED